MNALFLKDLADKTHRGLRGRVAGGKSAGGLCYRYQFVRQVDELGERVLGERVLGERCIHVDQHPVVARIFTMFAAGHSLIAIARGLNLEKIQGPGGRAWRDTTIRAHRERGTDILRNEMYIGRMVWNRMRYMKDSETGPRVSRMNPVAQRVNQEVPHLRILDDTLWAEVQNRLGSIEANTTRQRWECIPYRTHRRAQDILTGRVFCGVCSGTLGNPGQDYLSRTYASQTGTCSKCATAENQTLGAHVTRHRGLQKAQYKLDKLVDAIASGLRSTTLQTKLARLETRRAELEHGLETLCCKPTALPRDLAAAYRQELAQLHGSTDGGEGAETREPIRGLIDHVAVTPAPHGKGWDIEVAGEIAAMIGLVINDKDRRSLLRLAVFCLWWWWCVVAGTGFEPVTFRL